MTEEGKFLGIPKYRLIGGPPQLAGTELEIPLTLEEVKKQSFFRLTVRGENGEDIIIPYVWDEIQQALVYAAG